MTNQNSYPSAEDMAQLIQRQSEANHPAVREQIIRMNAAPKVAKVTVTSGASVLIATGAASLTARKTLRVTNLSDHIPVVLGHTSNAAIFSLGITLEPGQTIVFEETTETPNPVYGRSVGYAVELEVFEA